MGIGITPQYANIFMDDMEQLFINSHRLTPLLYLKFIDDICVIWTIRKEALENFHEFFNSFYPIINLTMNLSTQELHFLDSTVQIYSGSIPHYTEKQLIIKYTCLLSPSLIHQMIHCL